MTEEKEKKWNTINIKGKEYVTVAERILYFNENYPNGMITTKLLSNLEDKHIFMQSTIVPDVLKPERFFTGYSQAVVGQGMVNTTAALENCETSAVGRALAMLGIGVLESIASSDEINKAAPNPIFNEQKPLISNPVPSQGLAGFDYAGHFQAKAKVPGNPCNDCKGGMYYKNPKTGKTSCDQRCWLNKSEKVVQVLEEGGVDPKIPF